MASIQNSKAKFYEHVPQSGEEAKHTIESEADVFIKALSRKQLDTNITLEQLVYEKEFQLHHVYEPETSAGVVSLENFEDLCGGKEVRQNDTNNVADILSDSRISRHAKELALVVKPNSVETKLLKFAISCNSIGHIPSDVRPPDHPIHHLHKIEEDRFGHILTDTDPLRLAKTYKRKRRQMVTYDSTPIEVEPRPIKRTGKSLWDVTEVSTFHRKSKNCQYTCPKQKSYTISDQMVVEVDPNSSAKEISGEIEDVTEAEHHSTKKLSEADIKRLPKFLNYDKGEPSETLYLKNLASSVSEIDLSSLFSKYQVPGKPRITFKLLKKGRMRGQAFVDCHCVETAKLALEGVNGVLLYGKPIIIQFGSKKRGTG